jgi:hypothetical protein
MRSPARTLVWRVTLILWLTWLPAYRVAAQSVDTARYDAFWLWSGVAPQAVLARARIVYILHGQIGAASRGDDAVTVTAQGTMPRLERGEVWVVYRAHTLRWPPDVYATVLQQLERWRQAGNPIAGVQIDFDARASYLREYVAFLRDFRRRLPERYRLSITGLLDWSTNADAEVINGLDGIVDEVVVQTYQGRHTIADYESYLPRVARLTIPFKIGLIQHGAWREPASLSRSPWFRGYVVFLQNPATDTVGSGIASHATSTAR